MSQLLCCTMTPHIVCNSHPIPCPRRPQSLPSSSPAHALIRPDGRSSPRLPPTPHCQHQPASSQTPAFSIPNPCPDHCQHLPTKPNATPWAGGLSIGGGGVDRAPWLDPPQRGLNWRDPQNPTDTDPRASEVTQTQKLAKNENGIFGISASRGLRKIIICQIFGKKNLTIFNAQKIFGAFGARVHNN